MDGKDQLNQTMNFKNCLGVFQGGGCKALAFVGAYKEVKRRGVNFSEVAGTSAGSIFAALIAAGATPDYLENLLFNVDFKSFKAPADKGISSKFGFKGFEKRRKAASIFTGNDSDLQKILNILDNLGLYSSEELEVWLRKELQKLLNINDRDVCFNDLKLPLHVIATDINKQQQIIWNNSISGGGESVAKAVRSSCTIPLYFQPVDMSYLDGGLVSNLPSFTLNDGERHFEKILCFTLSGKVEPIKCFKSYFQSVASAVIDGAINIQEMLQNNTYNIVIKDLDVSTTDFELINDDLIVDTISKGVKAAEDFFNNEMEEISKSEVKDDKKLTRDHIMNSVVMENVGFYNKVYLCFDNTKLIYSLFPTILGWLVEGMKITFITKKMSKMEDKDAEHEKYRRFLINRFGINLIERESVPFNAFLFKGEKNKAICLYKGDDLKRNIGNGAIYDGTRDLYVNEALFNELGIPENENQVHDEIERNRKIFSIEKKSSENHIDKLKSVGHYQNGRITFEEKVINLDDMKLMTKYVESYKYNQIDKFNVLLGKYNLDLFEPSVIKFSDGVEFLITPIVLERHGGNHIVIKGNSRLSYLFREIKETSSFKAIVASGVTTPLPSIGRNYPIGDMIVTTKFKKGETRYENWIYDNFRDIEACVRNPKSFEEL
ncbi:patatin-like phospholipase family protein [Vibrio sp. 10N.222.49.A3]|uniref:patatin-like phospholipase family protein n=1 Tax=Vibrio sp. 10N.222.49.A3 TaxID=3229611 RepID=UPI003550F182